MNITPLGGTPAENQAAQQSANAGALGKDAFLQLLVAQIKNQDPLNPSDGVQFLSQLAQFSQLEQSIGIKDEISGLRGQVNEITEALNDAANKDETEGAGNV